MRENKRVRVTVVKYVAGGGMADGPNRSTVTQEKLRATKRRTKRGAIQHGARPAADPYDVGVASKV